MTAVDTLHLTCFFLSVSPNLIRVRGHRVFALLFAVILFHESPAIRD